MDPDKVNIATIDGKPLSLGYLVNSLRKHRQLSVIDDVMRRAVIEELFEQHEIEVDDDTVAEFQLNFREDNELHDESTTVSWLKWNRMSDQDFWDFCVYEAKLAALKEKVVGDQIEARFALDKVNFDRVELLHIIAGSDSQAREIKLLVEEGEDFGAIARRTSLESSTNRQGGYMGFVSREDLSAEAEAAIFSSPPGTVVGPFKGVRGHHLYMAQEFVYAALDENTRTMLLDTLFSEYVARIISNKAIHLILLDKRV